MTSAAQEITVEQPASPVATLAPHALAPEAVAQLAMTTCDGTRIVYRAWWPARRAAGAVLLFHRGHEHGGRFHELATQLAADGLAVFAPDQRGHGLSDGQRGYAPSFAAIVRDIDSLARHITQQHQIDLRDIAILGHSVGAVAVAAWVHDYAPPVRAMILAAPAFDVKLYVPLALPALRVRNRLPGRAFVKSYVRARMLTHDALEAQRYACDPLISRNIAVNVLVDLFDTSRRLRADAPVITVPTLVLSAGSDWVVRNAPQRDFFDRLGSSLKRFREYPQMSHAIFHEVDRQRAIDDSRDFLRLAFNPPLRRQQPAPRTPAASGHTTDEYERLSRPLPATSLKRLNFALQRLTLKTLGRLSDGIRLGWRRGFDSGESLDYVYENRARGITPLGRLIDRTYLNAAGWRGVRERKENLEAALRDAIAAIRVEGKPVRILDLATGGGRYVLDVLAQLDRTDDVEALLRDWSEPELESARARAAKSNLANIRLERGDAFDRVSIAAIRPRPNIAIVSGLYELFPDNGRILESLRGIADAIEPGGFLIYTGQPWHPQLEMIARVLRNREGKRWIMRRRPTAELDRLVASAGFVKCAMSIDDAGIFTVSVARAGK